MRKILIVEDEEILRESYQMILSSEPYEVDVANNGKVALDMVQNKDYDLILLDLMMPVMDGVTFLEHFTAGNSPTSKVIILSNLSTGEELTRALELGAHRNTLKASLSPKQLIALVRYEVEAS
jgi:DNA-binding response OmpR family regulator